MRLVRRVVPFLLIAAAALAQTDAAGRNADEPQSAPATQADLQALAHALAAQQRQIQKQAEEIQELKQQLQRRTVATPETGFPAPQARLQSAAEQSVVLESSSGAQSSMAAATTGATPSPRVPSDKEEPKSGIELDHGKLKLGALFYGDWSMYYNTGFGPQFNESSIFPGPGNNHFNSFDITRTYLNVVYTPSRFLSLRLTPDIYRQVGTAAADKVGKSGAVSSSVDGNLSFRLKYAYMDLNRLFGSSEALKGTTLTLGLQPNPLVGWEEDLYGYRFVSLVPWNYLSLSAAQAGVQLHGPVEFNGKQYLDYGIGVFDQANFHQFEQAESKQVMARLSYYPLAAVSGFQGLGLTGFMDYGYKNVTPDSPNAPLYRVAALVHYTSRNKGYGIAGEYDSGRNAFGTSNLFSGAGPADEFGVAVTPFANFDALARALLGPNGAFLQDVAVFGHAAVPHSAFAFFGSYSYTRPNTGVIRDPLDFAHCVLGISYRYSEHLRFALDGQNLIYVHPQFTFPAAELKSFSASLAANNPNGIRNAVPNNAGAIFLNTEFSF